MADEKKISYPKIPRNNWFLLREKFKQRTPERVSSSYIATALNMSEASASANIIPPLRAFGLIDEEGKPTDLAYDWRDDSKYAAVCNTIFENIYPQELRDIFHDPANIDISGIESWFARSAKVGTAAAKKFSSTYVMLLEADIAKAKEQQATKQRGAKESGKRAKTSGKKTTSPPAATNEVAKQKAPSPDSSDARSDDKKASFSPKLHVDIQIHISPDSSPEQIEKIFQSMAKHLPFKG